MKNIFELEGVIDSRDLCFTFLSRSIPFSPNASRDCTKNAKDGCDRSSFVEELSGMAIVKILDIKEQAMSMIKLKFIRNKAVFKITNNTYETVMEWISLKLNISTSTLF